MPTNSSVHSSRRTKPTFREIVAQEREPAAKRIWAKAKAASSLRHALRAVGRFQDARVLGCIKQSLVLRAIKLAPDQLNVTIDSDFHIGLFSIRWQGHGSLHLPIWTDLKAPQREPRRLAAAM